MMKKIYTTSLVMLLTLSIKAQTTLSTAVDFTATDTKGNSHNLFSILSSGKTVVISFIFAGMGPSQVSTPVMNNGYTDYGCNTQDLYFLAIDYNHNNSTVIAWEIANLGMPSKIPIISGIEGTGQSIHAAYNVTATPTNIIVAPNHQIISQYFSSANQVQLNSTLYNLGFNQKACLNSIEEENSVAMFSLFPNPTSTNLTLKFTNEEHIKSISITDILGKIVWQTSTSASNTYTIDISQASPGIYYVKALSDNGEVMVKKVVKE